MTGAIQITPEAMHPDDTDQKAPFLLGDRKRHRQQVAEVIDLAATDVFGSEYADVTTASTEIVALAPEEATVTGVTVYQSAADDGTAVSTVDVHAEGTSVLDSAVSLDDTGEATQSGTIDSAQEELDQHDRLEIVIGGESDDASPPTVWVQVELTYVDDIMKVIR